MGHHAVGLSRGFLAIGLVCACAVGGGGVALAVSGHKTSEDRRPSHETDFVITSTVSSSSSAQVPALLYPGVPRYLWYTVQNESGVPLTVTELRIASVLPPFNCPASNLDLSHTEFVGRLFVAPWGTGSVSVPIVMIDTSTNQDACQGTVFRFFYQGQATVLVPTRTDTFVASSPDPSASIDSVEYTVTVTTKGGDPQRDVSNSPGGLVNVYDNGREICVGLDLVANGPGSAIAQCVEAAPLSAGLHRITATYVSSSGEFIGSTSRALKQQVYVAPSSCGGHGLADTGDASGGDHEDCGGGGAR